MKGIKLVGIKGSQIYQEWLKNINVVLNNLNIGYTLEEVNTVDRILELNMEAIPALIVNEVVVLEQQEHTPDSKEIEQQLLAYL